MLTSRSNKRLFILLVVATPLLFLNFQWRKGARSETSGNISNTGKVRHVPPSAVPSILTPHGFPVPKCVSTKEMQEKYRGTIPPLVHWTSKDGRVASRLIPLVTSWRRLLNSSTAAWRFMHWDDAKISKLISAHYPQLVSSYAKLINGLERSDIGRLVVLHHLGGIYVDMDVELVRYFSAMHMSCFTAVWAQEPIEHARFLFGMNRLIANSIIMSRAKHSFLSLVLTEWPAFFKAKWAKKTNRRHYQAVFVTGPLMLQPFYERYANLKPADRPSDWVGTMLADPDMFQPIWDESYVPQRLRNICARPEKLNEASRKHCLRLALTDFQTKPVPGESFTVHRYLHLSYTDKMDMRNSSHIADLLPILDCDV